MEKIYICSVKCTINTVFSEFPLRWGGGTGGIPFITHMSLSMICRKSVDFVIFSQFFAILLKMTLPQTDP